MLKFIIIFVLIVTSIYADERDSATKIVKAIVKVIKIDNQKLWIDSEDKNINTFLNVNEFNFVSNCEEANVLLLREKSILSESCRKKPLLILEYDLFMKYDNAVAAFFWKKGRPNIVFIKDRIDKFDINLPKSYKKYQEETIW